MKWWNNKSAEEKWKVKAGIAWFGGALIFLFIIVETLFMPKINRFIEQASPSELIEVESAMANQITWMIVMLSITIVVSIIVMWWLDSKNRKYSKYLYKGYKQNRQLQFRYRDKE